MTKTLGKKDNFLGIAKKYSSLKNSEIVVLPVPLEKTVSYGTGTAEGPGSILEASHFVEFYDEEMKKEICFEKGICTLSPMRLKNLSHKNALEKIYERTKSLLDANKFIVILGGEHSLSSAPVRAFNEKYDHLSILQIDAHSDLRDSYEGSKYSHASVMRRIFEINPNIVQVGIRAQAIEEAEFIKQNNINTYFARDIRTVKFSTNWQSKVVEDLSENVFITFDVDGFDPSIIPATGTPEPGGLMWDEIMNLLKLVGQKKKIVGFDVVELAPSKFHPASSFSAAKLVYRIINYAFQR